MHARFAAWCGLPASMFDATWTPVPLVEPEHGVTGIGLLKGFEIHFALAPEHRHRAIQRDRAREYLRPMFDRLGLLTTRNDPANRAAHRFLVRLGFERTWSDGRLDHYMLTALPFGQET